MLLGSKITNIAIYHPSNVIHNDFYINHFKEQGKDVEHLLKDVLGKENRYIIQNEGKSSTERETTLTMQIEAAKKVLAQSGLTGKDIDGIITANQFPEYLIPPTFMSIHKAIDGKPDCFGYDLNANCIGMVTALEQADNYFANNPQLDRILIVGGDYMTLSVSPKEENFYGVFGDSGCAIILERTEGPSMLIDSEHFMNNENTDTAHFPQCGISALIENRNPDTRFQLNDSIQCDIPLVIKKIEQLLTRNHLTISDIKGFCFSQFSLRNNQKIMKDLNIPEEKCPYVGNIYGYTGCTSPFLALNELIKRQKIKCGDYLLFWTIGGATQHIILLLRY